MLPAAATRRLLVTVGAMLTCLVLLGSAQAAYAPVEPYAGYQPQTNCAPRAKPGTQAELEVWRKGERKTLKLTVGELPEDTAARKRADGG